MLINKGSFYRLTNRIEKTVSWQRVVALRYILLRKEKRKKWLSPLWDKVAFRFKDPIFLCLSSLLFTWFGFVNLMHTLLCFGILIFKITNLMMLHKNPTNCKFPYNTIQLKCVFIFIMKVHYYENWNFKNVHA